MISNFVVKRKENVSGRCHFVKGRWSHWTHQIWNKKSIYELNRTHFSNMVTKIPPIHLDNMLKTLLKIGGEIFILSKIFLTWIIVMKYKIWRIWDVINTFLWKGDSPIGHIKFETKNIYIVFTKLTFQIWLRKLPQLILMIFGRLS